jgi:hypothetical protein
LVADADADADDVDWWCTRAQHVEVIRAAHSLARKYPDKVALTGGKGRDPLWIGSPREIARWIKDHY